MFDMKPPTSVPFRCEGTIDPFTGKVEVRSVECGRMPEMEPVLRRRLQSLRRWNFSVAKLRSMILLILSASVLAALYGALHDQLSYAVAPEYFTKIKCRQMGIDPAALGGERWGAALVGAASTWWVGAIAATLLGLVGMIHPDRTMFRRTLRALFLVLITAVVFGLLGLGVGQVSALLITWAPAEVSGYENLPRVHAVRYMHAAGYWGGLFGLLIGIADLRRISCAVVRDPETDSDVETQHNQRAGNESRRRLRIKR